MIFEKKVAKFEKVSKKQWELSEGVIPYEEIKLPTRATEDSAGYDFYITKDMYTNSCINYSRFSRF